MSNSPEKAPSDPHALPRSAPAPRQSVSMILQLGLSLVVAGGVLAFLIWSGTKAPSEDDGKRPEKAAETVQVVGPRLIAVKAGTPLDLALERGPAKAQALTAAMLPVTGTALVSLSPGAEEAQDAWQFATPDLLSAFSDWQKAIVDIPFQKNQLESIRELALFRVEAQKEVADRMQKLFDIESISLKELIVEKVNLKQFEIQGKKEIHEAENAYKLAKKAEATLSRQLQQLGLEPTMLRSAAAAGEIVVADVPEHAMGRIKLPMTSEVRFFALPGRSFVGKVANISPMVLRDKRIISVQFVVKDPQHEIRPGMFATIDLGTDERRTLLMPADGALHIGDKDYALRQGTKQGTWQIVEVQLGELRGSMVEVLDGPANVPPAERLKDGEIVFGKGAILLKPIMIRALQAADAEPAGLKAIVMPGGKQP